MKFFPFALLFLLFASTGCEKDPIGDDLPIVSKSVHFDELAANLEAAFGPGCVGFQYTIAQNGQEQLTDAIGSAILAIDGNETPYSKEHRKSVHSMTKTISAAAMLHALNASDISVDASIAPYLPQRWDLDDAVENITFRELLTHTSGLRGTRDLYAQMRDYMEAGSFEDKSYAYANVNFTLMRFLIPMVNPIVGPALNETLNTDGDEAFDWQASQGYIAYVRNTVLIPAGIDEKVGPYLWDTEVEDATRNYNFSDQTINGYTHSDLTLITGAGGWYMNSRDYAAFISHLVYDALDGLDAEFMLDNLLGLYFPNYNGINYYTHNGGVSDGLGRGGRSEWIHIPSTGVTMVVQINSNNNAFTGGQIPGMMLDAYIASYY